MITKKATVKIADRAILAPEHAAPDRRLAERVEPEVVGVEAGDAAQRRDQEEQDDGADDEPGAPPSGAFGRAPADGAACRRGHAWRGGYRCRISGWPRAPGSGSPGGPAHRCGRWGTPCPSRCRRRARCRRSRGSGPPSGSTTQCTSAPLRRGVEHAAGVGRRGVVAGRVGEALALPLPVERPDPVGDVVEVAVGGAEAAVDAIAQRRGERAGQLVGEVGDGPGACRRTTWRRPRPPRRGRSSTTSAQRAAWSSASGSRSSTPFGLARRRRSSTSFCSSASARFRRRPSSLSIGSSSASRSVNGVGAARRSASALLRRRRRPRRCSAASDVAGSSASRRRLPLGAQPGEQVVDRRLARRRAVLRPSVGSALGLRLGGRRPRSASALGVASGSARAPSARPRLGSGSARTRTPSPSAGRLHLGELAGRQALEASPACGASGPGARRGRPAAVGVSRALGSRAPARSASTSTTGTSPDSGLGARRSCRRRSASSSCSTIGRSTRPAARISSSSCSSVGLGLLLDPAGRGVGREPRVGERGGQLVGGLVDACGARPRTPRAAARARR